MSKKNAVMIVCVGLAAFFLMQGQVGAKINPVDRIANTLSSKVAKKADTGPLIRIARRGGGKIFSGTGRSFRGTGRAFRGSNRIFRGIGRSYRGPGRTFRDWRGYRANRWPNYRSRRYLRYALPLAAVPLIYGSQRRYYYDDYDYGDDYYANDYGSSCDYWHRRCVRNWGSRNSNYYGCMKYHRCR